MPSKFFNLYRNMRHLSFNFALVKTMNGIYSESVNDFTRDESPMVYKVAKEVITNIGDALPSTQSLVQS